ncbi:Ribosome-recycling factor [Spiroplasma sp. JKS002669]|uniref:ribosome recycling factor n=1 Tax=Spiroplasma attinicola TaxID=2904537 RepID=UPI0020231425|nr:MULTISPECIES: ribosome recycling factor [unclassified Spiroplasma]MCL6428536.1 Ribosome-recycling factor [Spiroplasma sp. JKS002669]MCL8209869.1 Ribosome-recycling factor [Spiroplasma sp. JKS002670]MCL8210831.1 Ribosome-recycling factor [Spiroplasma sp. JKS002671]
MDALILETTNCMDKIIQNYEKEISKIRTGRANPDILDHVKISAYGNFEPLKSVAQIKVPEARQLLIKPYDPNSIKVIVEALNHSGLNLQFTVENNNAIRITFPVLTEDVRKRLVRDLAKITEEFRIKIRNCRRDAIQKLKTQNLPEDNEKKSEQSIQKLTDEKVNLINNIDKDKVADLMQI